MFLSVALTCCLEQLQLEDPHNFQTPRFNPTNLRTSWGKTTAGSEW